MNRYGYLLALSLFAGGGVLAQHPASLKDSTKTSEKNQLVAGLTYNSAMNYYGRVDSQTIRGLFPFVGFDLRNGLYVNSTFVFINDGVSSEYAATLLEAGYNFHNKKETWAGNLFASKFIYRDGTGLVESVIREDAGGSLTQLNKVLNITLGADVKFSTYADPGAQAGLDHTIRFKRLISRKDVLVLDPSAYVYAGTQQFTQTFYQQEQFLIFPVGERQVTANDERFSVLAYECSLPLVYACGKFTLVLDPAYVVPENVLPDQEAAGLSVIGKNMFYVSGTVKFSL